MPRLSTLSVGQYIRHTRKAKHNARGNAAPILKIQEDAGNSFKCHPVLSFASGVATIDNENYLFIDKNQEVEQAFP